MNKVDKAEQSVASSAERRSECSEETAGSRVWLALQRADQSVVKRLQRAECG